MSMTARERVLMALNHEEPDRVPLFIGTSGATSVLGAGYPGLRRHLGLSGRATRYISKPLQYVWMDEDVLERLGSDGRVMAPGGYIAAAVHCIQPDVPPANIVTMCEQVKVAGRYPLRVK